MGCRLRGSRFTALLSRHQLAHLGAFDETIHQNDQRLLIFVRK
jgi:hypothetical protein